MQRKAPEIKQQEEMWNFVSAWRKLLSFQLPKDDLHQRKRDFINVIKKKIRSTTLAVNELLQIHEIYQQRLSNVDIAGIAEQYRVAHELAFNKARIMLVLVNDELKRYYANELHFDESDQESFQAQSYIDLLNYLQTCCLGICNNNYTINACQLNADDDKPIGYYYDIFKRTIDESAVLYDFALASGGSFIPAFQDFDPLIGSTENQHEKFGSDLGQCHGHIIYWAWQIAAKGTPKILNLVNTFTAENQVNQPYSEKMKIKSVRRSITEIMKEIGFDHIYKIGIFHQGGGHALGVRRIPGSTTIEFFEPNVGLFRFGNEEKFIDFFQLYLSNLSLRTGACFSHINVLKTYQQRHDVPELGRGKPVFNPAAMSVHTNWLAYRDLFATVQMRYQQGNYKNLKPEILQKVFVDQLLVRIKYTNDASVLEKLLAVLSLPLADLDNEANQSFIFLEVLHAVHYSKYNPMHFFSSQDDSPAIALLKQAVQGRLHGLAEDNRRSPVVRVI